MIVVLISSLVLLVGVSVFALRILMAHHQVLQELGELDRQVDQLLAMVHRYRAMLYTKQGDFNRTADRMNWREMQKLHKKFREDHDETKTNAGRPG